MQGNKSKQTKIWLSLLSASALLGVIVSVFLTTHYYSVKSATNGFKSYCNLGQAMNCDAVAASTYAELIKGVPFSSLTAGWFLALFIIAMFAMNKEWRRESVRAAFVLSLIAVIFSAIFFAIMAFVLKTYCILCLVIDVVSLSSLASSLFLKPEGLKLNKPDWGKWRTLMASTASALFVAVIGLKGLDSATVDSSTVRVIAEQITYSSPVFVNTSSELPSIGHKDAPITIVEFSDFQCPYCKVGAITLHSLMNRYPGKIRVIFKNFPLDPTCNKTIEHRAHSAACEAARIALCAHRQGKFKAVYEKFFEKQEALAPGRLMDMVVGPAGLNAAELTACVSSAEIDTLIAKDVNEATGLGVKSTPSFFINGRKIEGAYPLDAWIMITDSLLKQ
ncbi:MAG: thioredoxin domain-containing protein [Bdellovibrionota bacterium]